MKFVANGYCIAQETKRTINRRKIVQNKTEFKADESIVCGKVEKKTGENRNIKN